MARIRKLLVANRGEIAVRIMKTAKRLGIHTVAVYAENDYNTLHVHYADEAFPLGEGKLSDTYLNLDKLENIIGQSEYRFICGFCLTPKRIILVFILIDYLI